MSLVAFSIEERNRRWDQVRKLMAERGVQVLVAFPQWMPGDALYLANRLGAVILPLEDDPILVSARLETQAPPGAWIQQLRPATSTGTTAVPYGEAVAGVLKELGDGVQLRRRHRADGRPLYTGAAARGLRQLHVGNARSRDLASDQRGRWHAHPQRGALRQRRGGD